MLRKHIVYILFNIKIIDIKNLSSVHGKEEKKEISESLK
jgi:hypothetical protein